MLSDALTEGAADSPDLMIDFATLTGAARIALGADLPAMFSNDETVATGIAQAGRDVHDEVWRMPLHAPYRALIESKVADIMNGSSQPYGGAITAALFLQAFVPDEIPWAHFDIMAWTTRARPARPVGGEAMALRACVRVSRKALPAVTRRTTAAGSPYLTDSRPQPRIGGKRGPRGRSPSRPVDGPSRPHRNRRRRRGSDPSIPR